MATYRERREAKAERLREWSAKREQKAAASFEASRAISDNIPLGQPVLVGHHSEKRHRRDIERIDGSMRRSIEHSKMAEGMTSRADTIEAQLGGAIYSDDPDAVPALEKRIADLTAKRDRMKAENVAARKGGAGTPHQPYSLKNLTADIARNVKRLKSVEATAKLYAQAQASPGGMLVTDCGNDYVCIRFAEKPERATIDTLKTSGFSWSGGAWGGYRSKLPDGFLEALRAKAVA